MKPFYGSPDIIYNALKIIIEFDVLFYTKQDFQKS